MILYSSLQIVIRLAKEIQVIGLNYGFSIYIIRWFYFYLRFYCQYFYK